MSVIYSGKTARKGRRKYNMIFGRTENQFISKSSHLGVPWTMLLISSHAGEKFRKTKVRDQRLSILCFLTYRKK